MPSSVNLALLPKKKDLFDAQNPTQDATPYKQQQTQDWNNPFPNTHSPYSTDEGRYLEDTSRAEEDSRSIGTRRSTYSTGTRRSTYTAASSSMACTALMISWGVVVAAEPSGTEGIVP